MATAVWMEPGTDATQDLSFYASTSGTAASATDQFVTGSRSLKLSTGAGAVSANANSPSGILADAGRRINWRIRFSALDASNSPLIFEVFSSGGSFDMLAILLTPAGHLKLTNGQGTTFVTGTTVLAINTWYRITVSYTITSTTVWSCKVYVNGALDITTTNTGTLANTGSSSFGLDAQSGGFGFPANTNVWFDDVYADNGSDLGDPGDIRVTAKRPFANGTTNGFTTQIGSGGSGYGSGHAPQVNERPLSQTNGWSMVGAGSAVTEEYAIEGASVGDVDISGAAVIDFLGWVFAKALASETASIIVAGASSNIALTSTPTLFTKAAGSTTYPGGGTDIGIVTSTTVTTVSLYECGVLVAYTPKPFLSRVIASQAVQRAALW